MQFFRRRRRVELTGDRAVDTVHEHFVKSLALGFDVSIDAGPSSPMYSSSQFPTGSPTSSSGLTSKGTPLQLSADTEAKLSFVASELVRQGAVWYALFGVFLVQQ